MRRRGRENIFHFPTAAEAIKISNCCKYTAHAAHSQCVYKSLKAFLLGARRTALCAWRNSFNMCVILRLPATACILLPAPLALLTIISKRGYIPATTIKIAGGGENYRARSVAAAGEAPPRAL